MKNKFDHLQYTVNKLKYGLEISYHYNLANRYNLILHNQIANKFNEPALEKFNLHKNLADNLAKIWDFNYTHPTLIDSDLIYSFFDPVDTEVSSDLYYIYDKASFILDMLKLKNKAIDEIHIAEQSSSMIEKYRHLSSAHDYNTEALDKAEAVFYNFTQPTYVDSVMGEAIQEVRNNFDDAVQISGQIETEIFNIVHFDYAR
ncbi:MAG: hypothetical protein ACK4OM_05050 [Alphaproteobacteria bacterium]